MQDVFCNSAGGNSMLPGGYAGLFRQSRNIRASVDCDKIVEKLTD